MKIKIHIILLILFAAQYTYSQDKAFKILLTDGSIRSFPTASITEITFTDDACGGVTSVEYEGRKYNTVQIGTQCWFKENLNVGTRIDLDGLPSNGSSIEKWCYNNDESMCNAYGGLYSWDEAVQWVSNTKGICPDGWHIPTQTEMQTLITSASNKSNNLVDETVWTTAYTANNSTGFSALFTGYRHYVDPVNIGQTSDSRNIDVEARFWSSEYAVGDQNKSMGFNKTENSSISFDQKSRYNGYSIRCIKGDGTTISGGGGGGGG